MLCRQALEGWPQYAGRLLLDGSGRPAVHVPVFQYFLFWTAFYMLRGPGASYTTQQSSSKRGYRTGLGPSIASSAHWVRASVSHAAVPRGFSWHYCSSPHMLNDLLHLHNVCDAAQSPKQGRSSAEHPYLQVLRNFLAALLPRTAEAKSSQAFAGACRPSPVKACAHAAPIRQHFPVI